jgi:protein TonB
MEIGLVIALVAVVGAFMWSQEEKKVVAMVDNIVAPEAEVVVNTEQQQKQPEVRPQVNEALSEFIDVVRNETQINTTYDFAEFNETMVVDVPKVAEEVVEEIPIFNAEEMPTFQGGDLNAFRNWVLSKLKYPQIAAENSIQGTVTLKFVIERDGTLTNIEEIASPDRSLSDEAIRILKQSPKWSPGKQRNKAVRVAYILPVLFKLETN